MMTLQELTDYIAAHAREQALRVNPDFSEQMLIQIALAVTKLAENAEDLTSE